MLAKIIVDEGILVYGDEEEYRVDMLGLYKLFLDRVSIPPRREARLTGEQPRSED